MSNEKLIKNCKILFTIDLYPALNATVNKFSDLINKFY